MMVAAAAAMVPVPRSQGDAYMFDGSWSHLDLQTCAVPDGSIVWIVVAASAG